MLELSSASVEYVRVQVAASEAGTPIDPTGDVVALAFLATSAAPAGGDWRTGSWEVDVSVTPHRFFARCLVGPGQVVLPAGLYSVWVRVTDSPEVPVLRAGLLRVV